MIHNSSTSGSHNTHGEECQQLGRALKHALARDDTLSSGTYTAGKETLVRCLLGSGQKIVPSTDGLISIVSDTGSIDDYSQQSGFFDFHTDGLYLPAIPRLVFLYCMDPGNGSTPTAISDGAAAVDHLRGSSSFEILKLLELIYTSR